MVVRFYLPSIPSFKLASFFMICLIYRSEQEIFFSSSTYMCITLITSYNVKKNESTNVKILANLAVHCNFYFVF